MELSIRGELSLMGRDDKVQGSLFQRNFVKQILLSIFFFSFFFSYENWILLSGSCEYCCFNLNENYVISFLFMRITTNLSKQGNICWILVFKIFSAKYMLSNCFLTREDFIFFNEEKEKNSTLIIIKYSFSQVNIVQFLLVKKNTFVRNKLKLYL